MTGIFFFAFRFQSIYFRENGLEVDISYSLLKTYVHQMHGFAKQGSFKRLTESILNAGCRVCKREKRREKKQIEGTNESEFPFS